MILDRLRKKKEEDLSPIETPVDLPDDLERFRVKSAEIPKPPDIKADYPAPELNYGKSVEDLVNERRESDKIELILQKLETIDARLRLMEEKMKRY